MRVCLCIYTKIQILHYQFLISLQWLTITLKNCAFFILHVDTQINTLIHKHALTKSHNLIYAHISQEPKTNS